MKPTSLEIQIAIDRLQFKLGDSTIEESFNFSQKEGFTEALVILKERREKFIGFEHLKTVRGRAIAVAAIEYLRGTCSQEILCGISLDK